MNEVTHKKLASVFKQIASEDKEESLKGQNLLASIISPMIDEILMKKKTIKATTLKAMIGKKPEEVYDEIVNLGFTYNTIPKGVAIKMIVVIDRVNLWLDEAGLVSKASTSDTKQTI